MSDSEHNSQCSCGHATFTVVGPAIGRGFCHCSICQKYTNSAYSDVSIFRAQNVVLPQEDLIEFRKYRRPPSVQRGKCKRCGGAVLELMNIFPIPKLVIVPTGNIPESNVVDPSFHMFYDNRRNDVVDALPKYSGYWQSQIGLQRHLMAALWRTRADAQLRQSK